MNKILQNKWYWLTLLLGTFIFYILNLNTSMWGDDYMYMRMPGDRTQRCDTILKYLVSMPEFYRSINGRIADMMLRFTTSLLGLDIFHILNTFVFVLLVHTLTSLSGMPRRVPMLTLVYSFILWLFPYPGESMLWMAGAFNYLWSCACSLLVVIYIIKHNTSVGSVSNWHHVRVAVLAFVAGGMNESFSTALLVSLILFFLFNPKKLHGANITLLLFFFAGVLLIVLSPGAWIRLNEGTTVRYHMGTYDLICERLYNLMTKTCHFITPLLACIIIAVKLWNNKYKELVKDVRFWLIPGGMTSIIVFSVLSERAYVWYSVSGFIVVAFFINQLLATHEQKLKYMGILTGILCLYPTYIAIKSTRECKAYDDMVEQKIKDSVDGVITITTAPIHTRFYHLQRYDNSSTWRNQYQGFYYNKENVQYVTQEVFDRYKDTIPFIKNAILQPYISQNPEMAKHIYAISEGLFTIIPIESDSIKECSGDYTRLYYTDMEAHMGHERYEQSKFWGTNIECEKFPQYHLQHDDYYYIILPLLNDSITRIEIPVKVNRKNNVLIFNHI